MKTKFCVNVNAVRRGCTYVEAETKEEAETIASGKEIAYHDEDYTYKAEPVSGYNSEKLTEPLILEAPDWSPDEWTCLCKLCGLPPEKAERIVLHVSKMEYYIAADLPKLPEQPGNWSQVVTELCPHCDNEIEMFWDVSKRGYKAVCPVCGNRLMLCDECTHVADNSAGFCDFDSEADSCWRSRGESKPWPEMEYKKPDTPQTP